MVDKMTKEEKITQQLNAKATADMEAVADAVKKADGDITVFCGIPMGQELDLPSGKVVLAGIPMSHIVSSVKGQGFLPAGKFGQTKLKASQWDEILAKYSKYDFIVNGVIFAKADADEGCEIAKERSGKELENNLGFDQANPKKGKTRKSTKED